MATKTKYLLRDQVSNLLGCILHNRDKAIFLVAYWHGLRASEVGKLQLDDWRPATKKLFITRAKGSNSGEYPLAHDAVRPLQTWLRDRGDWPGPIFPSEQRTPISRFRLHQLIRQYGERCGIPIELRHFHVLRHSIAVHMTEDGQTMAFVQDWLGHRSIISTEKYAKLTNRARDNMAEDYFASRSTKKSEKPPVKWNRKKR